MPQVQELGTVVGRSERAVQVRLEVRDARGNAHGRRQLRKRGGVFRKIPLKKTIPAGQVVASDSRVTYNFKFSPSGTPSFSTLATATGTTLGSILQSGTSG